MAATLSACVIANMLNLADHNDLHGLGLMTSTTIFLAGGAGFLVSLNSLLALAPIFILTGMIYPAYSIVQRAFKTA